MRFYDTMFLGRQYVEAALRSVNTGCSHVFRPPTDLAGTKKAIPCGAGVGILAVNDGIRGVQRSKITLYATPYQLPDQVWQPGCHAREGDQQGQNG